MPQSYLHRRCVRCPRYQLGRGQQLVQRSWQKSQRRGNLRLLERIGLILRRAFA
jgi:hypothetical protein